MEKLRVELNSWAWPVTANRCQSLLLFNVTFDPHAVHACRKNFAGLLPLPQVGIMAIFHGNEQSSQADYRAWRWWARLGGRGTRAGAINSSPDRTVLANLAFG